MFAWQVAIAAFAVMGVAAQVSERARAAASRAVATGLVETAGVICAISLAYWGLGYVVSAVFDAARGAVALDDLNHLIVRVQLLREHLLGAGGWRLVVGLVIAGVAALMLGAAPAQAAAAAAFKGAKVIRRVGLALAVASVFGFAGAETDAHLARFEARVTKAHAEALAAYSAAAAPLEAEARVAAVEAIAEVWAERCADPAAPPDCDPMHLLEIESAAGVGRQPGYEQGQIWPTQVFLPSPSTDPSDIGLVETTPTAAVGRLSADALRRQAPQISTYATRQPQPVSEVSLRDAVVRELVSYGAGQGYEAAIGVAQQAGVSGEVTTALLSPLLGDALTGVVSAALSEAVAAMLNGRAHSEAIAALKTRIKDACAAGPFRAGIDRSADDARAAVQRAAEASRNAQARYDAAQAVAAAASTGAGYAQSYAGGSTGFNDSVLRTMEQNQRMAEQNRQMMEQNRRMTDSLNHTSPGLGGVGRPGGIDPNVGRPSVFGHR